MSRSKQQTKMLSVLSLIDNSSSLESKDLHETSLHSRDSPEDEEDILIHDGELSSISKAEMRKVSFLFFI